MSMLTKDPEIVKAIHKLYELHGMDLRIDKSRKIVIRLKDNSTVELVRVLVS